MNHSIYMQKALELARSGWPAVAPNPMVGCVIVKDDKIIAEGYHQKYGGPHAEVNAINFLSADTDLSDCVLYVNLEPCCHFGKTPPCCGLIVAKRFKKVVIANLDPNPLVAGKGLEKIKQAGIQVEMGVLEKEGRELNKRFFTFHEKKRPYIILKWAQTDDGFIGKIPFVSKEDNWISGNKSKVLVHQWRSEEQAVMVGANTVIKDNPELTTRLVKGNNPLRIVLDNELKLPPDSNVFSNDAETFVFNSLKTDSRDNLHYFKIRFSENILPQILELLHKKNISSVIIEGGAQLLQSFIDDNLWDEARVLVNPNKKFGKGVKAPEMKLTVPSQKSGEDLLYVIKNS